MVAHRLYKHGNRGAPGLANYTISVIFVVIFAGCAKTCQICPRRELKWRVINGILHFVEDHSLYLHVPFCKHRCAYCDFNTYAGQESLIPAYVDALCREMELVSSAAGERVPVHTIFFGGGTPSLLPEASFDKILHTIRDCFGLRADAEMTLEANPGTVAPDYLRELRRLGFNRISFGVQSAHPDDLRLLERQHNYLDVVQAVEWARRAGFDNLSLDLIFGVPFQTLERWQRTLDLALGLRPDHLSLYALTVEHGTPFQHWAARGLVPLPDDDLAADMYEWASARLFAAGYHQYEISNWAALDAEGNPRACRHNLQYWRDLPYLGFGAGAHGYAAGTRTANVPGIRAFIERCRTGQPREFPLGSALANAERIDPRTEMQEFMMVGLRLTEEGVSEATFARRFGTPLREVFKAEIERLLAVGLLEWSGAGSNRLRLTPRGRLLGNQVFMQFVGSR